MVQPESDKTTRVQTPGTQREIVEPLLAVRSLRFEPVTDTEGLPTPKGGGCGTLPSNVITVSGTGAPSGHMSAIFR